MNLFLLVGLDFSELQLAFDERRGLRYLPEPLARFCVHNGLDPKFILSNADRAYALIGDWYRLHTEAGLPADPVANEMLGRLRDYDDFAFAFRAAQRAGRRVPPRATRRSA